MPGCYGWYNENSYYCMFKCPYGDYCYEESYYWDEYYWDGYWL